MKRNKSNVPNAGINLHLDWCSFKAAKYAVTHWHYSRRMPVFKVNCIGVWESDKFIGAIVFGLGAAGTCNGAQYGLRRNFDIVELCRVALSKHITPVSRMLSIAIKMLKKKNPGLKLIISFADTRQGHHGGIYIASNWIYTGDYDSTSDTYIVHGKEVHSKTLHSRYGSGTQSIGWLQKNIDPKASRMHRPPKHRFLYILDETIRDKIEILRKPNPKSAAGVKVTRQVNQLAEGGAIPTAALQSETDATT